jgi:UDP-N-acetylmuramoylalanine--D-glutamate ligase
VVVLGPTICVAEVARLWRSGGRPNSGEFGYFDERSNPEFADRVDDSELPPLLVPGAHNRANARLAATAALAAGCEWSAIQGGLKDFAGLAHRLEYLGQFGGLRCYNDSMATTPESVQAALASLAGPIWLLAGGRNKGADLSPICVAAANLAAGVCFYGDSRRELSDGYSQLRLGAEKPPMGSVVTLAQAVAWCVKRAGAGDALLLSPGCSSLDQFADYRERAAVFEQLVRGLRVSVSTANRAATAV